MLASLIRKLQTVALAGVRNLKSTLASDPDVRWMIVSLVIALTMLVTTKSPLGDSFGLFTDHLHHSRATWTFLHVGLDAFTEPFSKTGGSVYFPQPGITWGQLPVPYPPGMFLVFLPLALAGRYIEMSSVAYAKLGVLYMIGLMHVGLWYTVKLLRSETFSYRPLLLGMLWIFALRAALQGFYEGAFLWAGAIATLHLKAGRPAAAVMWYSLSAFISYRGAAFASFALLAAYQLLVAQLPLVKKLMVFAFCVICAVLTAAAFWALMTHSTPAGRRGAESVLLPLEYKGYVVIVVGLVFSIALSIAASLLVGATALVSTVLCILHAGHSWHGFVCFPVAMALGMNAPRRDYAPLLVILYIAFMWQFSFGYAPFHWLEELLRFIERGGAYK
jgi:hypothetical protein